MTVRVFTYPDSGTAYDDSQCNDAVKDGDVLVVCDGSETGEKSVAILMGAWPICVVPGFKGDTDTRFDCPKPGSTPEDVIAAYTAESWVTKTPEFYEESLIAARAELARMGSRSAAYREGAAPPVPGSGCAECGYGS